MAFVAWKSNSVKKPAKTHAGDPFQNPGWTKISNQMKLIFKVHKLNSEIQSKNPDISEIFVHYFIFEYYISVFMILAKFSSQVKLWEPPSSHFLAIGLTDRDRGRSCGWLKSYPQLKKGVVRLGMHSSADKRVSEILTRWKKAWIHTYVPKNQPQP